MELWDLYTEDREKTGLTHPRGEKMPKGYCRLSVHICIFNEKHEMLIQQRQPFKESWSGMWDLTVGGSAVAGEDSRTAAHRELMEEIGLAHDFSHDRPALTWHYSTGFDDIYILHAEPDLASLTLQEEEVQAVRWADEAEICRLIREGQFIAYPECLIGTLFFLRDHRGMHEKSDSTVRQPRPGTEK